MEKDQGKALEQIVFSGEFRRATALFILPPVAAGAIGLAAGCAGPAAYRDYACDPLKSHRHDPHIEQTTSTGTWSLSADVVMVYQWAGKPI